VSRISVSSMCESHPIGGKHAENFTRSQALNAANGVHLEQ
jgi:hypothetical protein